MSNEVVLYSVRDAVATITLNRPDKLNAFTTTMTQELLGALKRAERDESVRALVLTGAGRAFSAGQDLAELQSDDVRVSEHLAQGFNLVIERMRALEKPILGAINGVAAGAALGIALATDVRIASEQASFISAFVRIGLVPDSGVSWFLTQMLGPARALELMLSGQPLSAERAVELGLVSMTVGEESFSQMVEQWSRRLAAGPAAMGLTKRVANKAIGASLQEMLVYEASLQDVAVQTEDHAEGVAAFLEKREAAYTGR